MPDLTVIVNPVNQTCTPATIRVSKTLPQNVPIMFQIDPTTIANWSWSRNPNPVVVQASGAQFSDGAFPANGGKSPVRVLDRHIVPGDNGRYKYTATLVQDGTNPPVVVSIDPWIENEADSMP